MLLNVRCQVPIIRQNRETCPGRVVNPLFGHDSELHIRLTSWTTPDQPETWLNSPRGHHVSVECRVVKFFQLKVD